MIVDSPYPGLRPFQRDEAHLFFGREEQTDELLCRLQETRFLAVVGPSGCGKSSLVRAGMIAALETGFMVGAGSRWEFAIMRPGCHPIHRLATALTENTSLSPRDPADAADALGLLTASLRRGPLGLVEALQITPLPQGTNLLLLVDQFEEIFRFRREGGGDEADAFVALLIETARQREVPVYVVITMRSDFFGHCAVFAGLPEVINESQYLTPRLSREQRQAAIVGPARVYSGDVEPTLVNRLSNEMGSDPDQLPLMQHLLMRMWTYRETGTASAAPEPGTEPTPRVLTVHDYMQIGGLRHALSNHADEAYGALTAKQRKIAQSMFRRLSDRGEDQLDVRRPTPAGELASLCEVPLDEVVAVVDVFRAPGVSFLTPAWPETIDAASVLDISHESLIRQWQRLKDWAREEWQSAETYRFLEQTAWRWRDGRAALWGTPNLEQALDWRTRERPSAVWAERYRGDFALAMAFLDASEQARVARDVEAEAARQREVQQALRLADMEQKRADAERQRAENQIATNRRLVALSAVMGVVFLVAVATAAFAWLKHNEALVALDQGLSVTDAMVKLFYDPMDNLIAIPTAEIQRQLPHVAGAIKNMADASGNIAHHLKLQNTRASLHNLFADLYARQGDFDDALAEVDQAIRMMEDVEQEAEALPDSSQEKQDVFDNLAESYNRIGQYGTYHRSPAYRIAAMNHAIKYGTRLTQISDSPEWYRDLMVNYSGAAFEHMDQGNRDEARQYLDRVFEVGRYMKPSDPSADGQVLASSYATSAVVYSSLGEPDIATQLFGKALAVFEQMEKSKTVDSASNYSMAVTRSLIGQQLASEHQVDSALEEHGKAIRVLEDLTLRDPKNALWQNALATAYLFSGFALAQSGRADDALAEYRRGGEIWSKLVEDNNDNVQALIGLLNYHNEVTGMLQRQQRHGEAVRESQLGEALLQRIFAHLAGGNYVLLRRPSSNENGLVETYYTEKGQLFAPPSPGYAVARIEYDTAGNMNEVAFYGTDGNLVVAPMYGFAILRREYNKGGQLVQEVYYDANGELIPK